MGKYIIDLNPVYVDGEYLKIPTMIAGSNSWIKTGVKLTPYTEPDTSDAKTVADAYKKWYETEYGDGTEAVVMPDDKIHEAYQRGYSAGKVNAYDEDAKKITKWIKKSEEAYQNGMDAAWEAAKKIGSNSMCSLKEMGFDFSQCVVRDYNPSWFVVKNYSAAEAIEKIRQYEQEKEEIKVGDEVEGDNECGVVIDSRSENSQVAVLTGNSKVYAWWSKCAIHKTGRYFPEIAEIIRKINKKE